LQQRVTFWDFLISKKERLKIYKLYKIIKLKSNFKETPIINAYCLQKKNQPDYFNQLVLKNSDIIQF